MIFSKKVFFTYNNNIFPKNKSFAELFNWQKYTAVSKIKKHQNIVLKIQTSHKMSHTLKGYWRKFDNTLQLCLIF